MGNRSRKYLFLIGVAAVLLICIVGIAYQNYDTKYLLNQKHADLKAVADVKEKQIIHWIENRKREARFVANNPYLLSSIDSYLKNPRNASNKKLIENRLSEAITKSEFEDVFLIDKKCMPLISVGENLEENLLAEESYIKKAFLTQEDILSDFYLCKNHLQQHLEIIVPLFLANMEGSAALVFRIDPNKYLFPFIETWPTASKSSETLLLKREQDSIVFLNILRHKKNIPGLFKVSLNKNNIVGVKAALGQIGITEGIDYRGEQVLADLRKISNTDWYLVSKIDKPEIYADIYYRFNSIALIIALIILAVITFLAITYFYKQKNYFKELYHVETLLRKTNKEFKAILYSIGDAVITTNKKCNITHMNSMAEKLTGWLEEDAIGKHISEVFTIVNEFSGVKIENPVERVIKDGVVVGLANHTILISKEGNETPIADSGSPILDDDGKLLGVVLVFRNQSEERKNQLEIETSRDKFLSLYNNMTEGVALHEIILDNNDKPINYRLVDVNNSYEVILELNKENIIGKLATEVYGTDKAPYLEEYSSVALQKENLFFETYFPPLKKHFEISVVPWLSKGFATIFADVTKRKTIEQEIVQANERWDTTFNSILDSIAIIDSDSNIIQCNKAFESFCQKDIAWLKGKKCHEVIHKIGFNYENCPLVRSKISSTHEMMEYTADDKFYSVIVDPILVNGKASGEYVHVIRDITESKKHEEQLREREENLSVTLQSIGDGVISTDINGNITNMNAVAEQLTGWNCKDALGVKLETVFNIINADTGNTVENPIVKVLSEGKIVGLANHTVLISKDGTRRQISDSAAPIKNNSGKILGVVLVFSDVTREYEIRKKIEENERALRDSQKVAKLGSYIFDVNSGKWTCTEILDEIMGIDKGYEKSISGWLNIVHQDYQLEMGDYLVNYVVGKKQRFDKEYKIVRQNDKEVRWVHGLGELQLDADLNVVKMIGVIKDITDDKEAEIRIVESEERFRKIFSTSPDGIVLTKLNDSQIVDVNSGFEMMTGLRRSEVMNQQAEQFGLLLKDESWKKLYDLVLQTGFANNLEIKIPKKDGSKITCLASASIVGIYEDNFVLLLLRDISERNKSHQELEMLKNHLQDLVNERTKDLEKLNSQLVEEIQKQKELETMLRFSLDKEHDLNELKTRFISTISHEFRTPLTTIFSSTEIIERKAKSASEDKYTNHTERIKKSIGYLTKLLDEVILINKAESGKLSFDPEMIDIKEFYLEIIDDMESQCEKGHQLVANFNMEKEKYFLDRKLMKFILSNLISNAHKFSNENGKITITLSSDENDLILQVKDEGIGIPDEDKPYMFEPFHRSKNSNNIPGTGLGLSIVKRSVDLHNGEISFCSELNKGTEFTIKIPKVVRSK